MRTDNKGKEIFFGLVALATLIVAIVGATLAYFSVMASSNEGAVNATAATVSITYSEGQEVSMNADNLIPIDFDDLQKLYERNLRKLESNVEGMTSKKLCQDDVYTQYQVCSVYRFSISSDSKRDITAKLNNEENGFTYLSYAIYDATNKQWLELNADGDSDLGIQKCTNTNNTGDSPVTSDDCVTDENGQKKYMSNSIFGLEANGEFVTKELVNGVEQTYDVILFIKNAQIDQNIDQGKKYSGHIVVDVAGGGDRIEGSYDENK